MKSASSPALARLCTHEVCNSQHPPVRARPRRVPMLLLPALLAGSFAFSPVKQEEALSGNLGQPPPFEESCGVGIACALQGNCDLRAWTGKRNGCCSTTNECKADGDDICLEVDQHLRVGRCCARHQYWTQEGGCKDRRIGSLCDIKDIDGDKVDNALACPTHTGAGWLECDPGFFSNPSRCRPR